jgi:hypothetical protein
MSSPSFSLHFSLLVLVGLVNPGLYDLACPGETLCVCRRQGAVQATHRKMSWQVRF